ncbi:Uma2 family endonuclease [Deinococcus budaensis]|uniref:Uma2 family endonuclease n=1 Tax=Deinococcus budaensis TaxID=1665626 RepID=A0A7W8LNL3_9DEIO|nr:Uma2 family endonuclease [Deinococcus budaensis]MBB5232687.1 Uma2 family endonuclease [Deinococcus budaensis]
MSDPAPTFWEMSEEEYLRTEPESPVKREFFGGYVYPLHGATVAQAGVSAGHGEISVSLTLALAPAARRQGCRLFSADMRVYATPPAGQRAYFYPDVVVTCEAITAEATSVRNPCLVVEVLSASTGHSDRTTKLLAYTSLPSLQTYLIIDPTRRLVRVLARDAEGWTDWELSGEGHVPIPCLNTTLTLDDVYAGVLDR